VSDDDVEDLARLAAQGDAAALDALLRAIQPRVLRQCGVFLPCRQDAEDACQDVLVAVARHITRFEGRARFSTWLREVTANSARSTYRSLKRRSTTVLPAEAVDRPDPRTTSVIAGSRLDLLEALDRLERDRPALVTAFVLRDLCDLEYAEIARRLDLPLGTVKARIHYARAVIRESVIDVSS
jgi:RNA polymerase sigma-70 factor (ECF subfamily)